MEGAHARPITTTKQKRTDISPAAIAILNDTTPRDAQLHTPRRSHTPHSFAFALFLLPFGLPLGRFEGPLPSTGVVDDNDDDAPALTPAMTLPPPALELVPGVFVVDPDPDPDPDPGPDPDPADASACVRLVPAINVTIVGACVCVCVCVCVCA